MSSQIVAFLFFFVINMKYFSISGDAGFRTDVTPKSGMLKFYYFMFLLLYIVTNVALEIDCLAGIIEKKS